MAIRQITLILSLLLAAVHGIAGTTSIINATCAAVAHNSTTGNTYYDYCVRALSADPAASAATDSRGLAAAAVGLAVVNITATEDIISDLIENLGRCLTSYRQAKDMVASGLDELRAGRDREASEKIYDAVDTDFSGLCDLMLVEGEASRDPVDVENRNVGLISQMASDITQHMLPSYASPPTSFDSNA